MPLRLVVAATHPVQYQAPYFRALAARPELDLEVWYVFLPSEEEQGKDFSTAFSWDVPVLDGYRWQVLDCVRRTGSSPYGFGAYSAPGLSRKLEDERPDAVLVTGWQSRVLVQVARAAGRYGVPRLLRGESNDLRRRPFVVRMAHRLFFRWFDAFLAIGRANRRLYERAGVPQRKIVETPYAVDNERFREAALRLRPRREDLRAEWGFGRDAFCVLFAGKLEPKKRPLDVLDALEVARRERLELRLLVAGSGELEAVLRDRARERRLPVTFAGFLNQTEMPRAYAVADALVLPSDSGETWGLVVNEAMASGVPAIVSDRVGCREDLVEEGMTGFSFPLGDTRALATCLVILAADPSRAAAMGELARARVSTSYSIDAAVAGTLAAISTAMGGRPPR